MKEKISDLFNRALSGKTISRLNNDFVLIENPEMDGSVEFPFKSNTVISIVVRSGSMACVVDMAVHRIDMQGMFIILPSQIVEKISFSDDFDGYCLLLSSAFLANMPMTNKIPLLANIKNHGFYAMDRQAFSALENYFKMAQGVLQNPNGYKHEILTHLTIAYFYGLGSYIHETATGSSLSSRYDQITNRFLELVRENCHIHRDMGFYAGHSLPFGQACQPCSQICYRRECNEMDRTIHHIERQEYAQDIAAFRQRNLRQTEFSCRIGFWQIFQKAHRVFPARVQECVIEA